MDISKPQLLFAGVWVIAFLLASLVETTMSVPFGWEMYLLVFGGIASFYIVAGTVRLFSPIPAGTPKFPAPADLDLAILSDFIVRIFVVWLLGLFANIAYSGGLPIVWLLLGTGRNYLDYGMPTVSGLLNMMRAFMAASIYLLYLHKRARRRDYLILAILIASALGEISRGVVSALLLHVVAFAILLRPLRLKQIVMGLPLLVLAFVIFDYVGNIRTLDSDMNLGEVLGGRFRDDSIWSSFVWSFTYITTPLNNLAFAISQHVEPLMVPYFTLQPLVPTVIRSMIWSAEAYPIELINEAFNATSFYAPLVTDFGVYGALIGFIILQILILLAYNSAKKGQIYGILVYPPIFVSIVLSFFYSYFFALPIVTYPMMAYVFMIYRRRTVVKLRRELASRTASAA
jgi:oligosaccharide repeat unit polymerase